MTQIEGVLGIIAACTPTLKPVLVALLPSLFTTSADNYGFEHFIASRTFGGTSIARPDHLH